MKTKTKHCPKCGLDLPREAFTSVRAKYCNNCKVIRQLEQAKEKRIRQIKRLESKKSKKQTIRSKSSLTKQAQSIFNAWIRNRDKKNKCISCKQRPVKHAGHYISQGSSKLLRFSEENVNGQCAYCNVWARGNLIEYRISLVKKIGEDRVKWLEEHRRDTKKWSREELEEIIEKYKL